MWINTIWGAGPCSSGKNDKKWCDLVHFERSKVRYYEPKINNFKDNKRALGRSHESDCLKG